MREVLLALSVFLACTVEAVEALTIVLAIGTTRGWRSARYGIATAVVSLAAVVAILGPALTAIPIDVLRLVVGGLLLIFGLQWLRKAILRAGGFRPLHDEASIYDREVTAAGRADVAGGRFVPDWYAFTLCFKGVLLEGLEVCFIVVTFGANQHDVSLAVVGAVVAVVLVTGAGFLVHRPLTRVPENTLKLVVGVMLTSFGTFWGAEGAGVRWPGSDTALPAVIAAVAVVATGLIAVLRRERDRRRRPVASVA